MKFEKIKNQEIKKIQSPNQEVLDQQDQNLS